MLQVINNLSSKFRELLKILKLMIKDFETKFTGWTFLAAAMLLWGGWALS